VRQLTRGQHLQAAAIAAVGTPVIEALGATYNWREAGAEHLRKLERERRQPIFAFWHGRVLAATLYFRDRGIIVITSENFDGEWIAGIIERFGYGTARGSTSRGGRKALRQLTRDMTAQDVENWDSMRHIQLITEVETAFGIKFRLREIMSMKNVGDLIDLIHLKRV